MRMPVLPFLALAAPLALAACNQPTSGANDDTANAIAAGMTANEEAAAADTDTDTADVPPAIAAPAVPADAPAEQAVPLTEAAEAAATIASDPTVTRVEWGDGWAWKRDGQIVRTASRDGKRVSYFHPGTDHPYLVQDGGESYGYDDNGRLAHVYDHNGRPGAPSAAQRGDADRLNTQARQDRDHARTAPPHQAPDRKPPPRPAPSGSRGHDHDPHPAPTPSPTPAGHDRHGGGQQGNGDHRDGEHDRDSRSGR